MSVSPRVKPTLLPAAAQSRSLGARWFISTTQPALGLFLSYIPALDAPDGNAPAWTDGTRIWHSPAFSTLSPAAQVRVEMHQILHVLLRHPQRGFALRQAHGPAFDEGLWNIVCDSLLCSTLTFRPDPYDTVVQGPRGPLVNLPGWVGVPEILLAVFDEDWTHPEAVDTFSAEDLYVRIQEQADGPACVKRLAAEQGWVPDMTEIHQLDLAQEAVAAQVWQARRHHIVQMDAHRHHIIHMQQGQVFQPVSRIGADGRRAGPDLSVDPFTGAEHRQAQADIDLLLACAAPDITAAFPRREDPAALSRMVLISRWLPERVTEENFQHILEIFGAMLSLDMGFSTVELALSGMERFFGRVDRTPLVDQVMVSEIFKDLCLLDKTSSFI